MNTKQTAEKVSEVVHDIRVDVLRKRANDTYDHKELRGIVYANCKAHKCTKLYEYIYKITTGL